MCLEGAFPIYKFVDILRQYVRKIRLRHNDEPLGPQIRGMTNRKATALNTLVSVEFIRHFREDA